MPEQKKEGRQQVHADSSARGSHQLSSSDGGAVAQFGGATNDEGQQNQRVPRENDDDPPRPPSEVLKSAGQQLKRDGLDLVEEASQQVQDVAKHQKVRAAGYIESVSRAAQAGAEALRRDGLDGSADLVARIADEVTEFADALSSKDPRQLMEDVNRFARTNPAAFLSAALLAGFGGARVIKSGIPPKAAAKGDATS